MANFDHRSNFNQPLTIGESRLLPNSFRSAIQHTSLWRVSPRCDMVVVVEVEIQRGEREKVLGAKSDTDKYYPSHAQSHLGLLCFPGKRSSSCLHWYSIASFLSWNPRWTKVGIAFPLRVTPQSSHLNLFGGMWNIAIFNSLQTIKQALFSMARIFL